MKNRFLGILSFALALAMSAHASGYRKLGLPKEQIAVLTNDEKSPIEIIRIDGAPIYSNPHGDFELLPGVHTISMQFLLIKRHLQYASEIFDVVIDAKAGSVMTTHCMHEEIETMIKIREESDNKGSFLAWIEDAASGKNMTTLFWKQGPAKYWLDRAHMEVLVSGVAGLDEAKLKNDFEQQKFFPDLVKLGVEEVVFIDGKTNATFRIKLKDGDAGQAAPAAK